MFTDKPKYIQKGITIVEAMWITDDNIDEVAEWCGGTVVGPFESKPDRTIVYKTRTVLMDVAYLHTWMVHTGDYFYTLNEKDFDERYISGESPGPTLLTNQGWLHSAMTYPPRSNFS